MQQYSFFSCFFYCTQTQKTSACLNFSVKIAETRRNMFFPEVEDEQYFKKKLHCTSYLIRLAKPVVFSPTIISP